ncbi:MAG TPA: hypothetical protein VMU02_11300 [bacterium]|nr:hypothetical protein [bacterium]
MTKMLLLSVVLLVTLGLGAATCMEAPRPTNIELVEKAVGIAADSMKLVPPVGANAGVSVQMTGASDAAWLVENIIKQKLIRAGWSLKAQADSTDTTSTGQPGFVLRLRVVNLGLLYGRSWRRYLVVGKRVERIARAEMFYDLEDHARGEVIASSNVSGEVRDVVPASALPSLTDPKYAFASPALDKSQWDRYVEGGLVLAIVGVLVYLFYSNKTAS